MAAKELIPEQQSKQANQSFITGEHEELLPDNTRLAIKELYEEAGREIDPKKRHDAEMEVALFGAELVLEELINKKAKEDIEAAKNANTQGREIAGTQESVENNGIAMLARKNIGWLASDGPISVEVERQVREGENFWLGSIIRANRTTKDAFNHLKDEGEASKLMKALAESSLPRFLNDLKSGSGNLRPVSKGTRGMKRVKPEHSLDTEYPAYKINVQGTNNRAIILLPEKREHDGKQEQVIILAALYDHEDQAKIYKNLFGKIGNLN